MIWLDHVILGIIAVSALISLFRGFFKEAISLATWALAFVLSMKFAEPVAALLPFELENPRLMLGIAFVTVFVLILILGGVVNMLVGKLVKKTGLSGTDRSIGLVFGLLRGVAIAGILVLMAGLTSLPAQEWWKQSTLVPYMQELALWMRGYLPDDLAANFSFDQEQEEETSPESTPAEAG